MSKGELGESMNVSSDSEEGPASLSKMVAVVCEQHLFCLCLGHLERSFLHVLSYLSFVLARFVDKIKTHNPFICDKF